LHDEVQSLLNKNSAEFFFNFAEFEKAWRKINNEILREGERGGQ
jgi:hypothetical protein